MGKAQDGFSLIELLIVTSIISVIASMAIPNLLSARRSANESATIGSLRAVVSAQATYQLTYGATSHNYGTPADLLATGLLDPVIAQSASTKSGYIFNFAATGSAGAGYYIQASPTQSAGAFATGTRHFYVDESGVIRANSTGTAISNDTPIQ
jgi:type IV pilus assembly protein PilA